MHSTVHIELVIESMGGKLTNASGFAWVISETEILMSLLAEAVSNPRADHHLTRTRYVRQVILIAGSIVNTDTSDS